jgi:ADP-ribose pyrophosphatase
MNLDDLPPPQLMWEGKFVRALKRGNWEYASRARDIRAVVILAEHGGKLILVSQPRAAPDCHCVELPAGLVGDEEQGEEIQTAAIRELEEETGYRAERMVDLGRFHASPGMSSEGFNLMRAEGLTRVGEGGGVPGEDIVVHHVKLDAVKDFIEERREAGCAIDVKLLLLLAGDFLAGA